MSMEQSGLFNMKQAIVNPSIEISMKEEELVTLNVNLNGVIVQDDNMARARIGNSTIYLINNQWSSEEVLSYIHRCANSVSGEKKRALNDLRIALMYLNDCKINFKGSIAFMYHFGIKQAFRGSRLTKPFLWLMGKALKETIKVDGILLQAYPVGLYAVNEIPSLQRRLENIYQKSGFALLKAKKMVVKSSEGYVINHMFCDVRNKSFEQFSV
ncbi:hypothetical protein [Aneurinibacillus terranovensis]|uniref:hypothetical protein n=1 Tax=Aneurinibacillus terranovensis TaxID=278991 RepID=UPI00041749D8|nr:hypothetical protein [Aneurinibacillus terranovensis]